MDSSDTLLSENRYMPFGETRTISGTTNISETDFGYTGQLAGTFCLSPVKRLTSNACLVRGFR